MLDSENMEALTNVIKAISARIIKVNTSNNDYEALLGNIKNASIYPDCGIQICTSVIKDQTPDFRLPLRHSP